MPPVPLTFASPLAPAKMVLLNGRLCSTFSCRLEEGVRYPSDSTVRITLTMISRCRRSSHLHLLHQDRWRCQRHPLLHPLVNTSRVLMKIWALYRCYSHPRRRRRRHLLAVRTLASLSLLMGLCFAQFWLPFWLLCSRCEVGI